MLLVIILIVASMFCSTQSIEEKQESKLETYIVFLQKPNDLLMESFDLDNWYRSFLPDKTFSSSEQDLDSWDQSNLADKSFSSSQSRMVHCYRHVATGFAARLTAEEVMEMKLKDGFVSARPSRMVSLHTTHTPQFLGLQQNSGVWNSSNYGKGIIIGLIDSGITPDHPSFASEGMPPPPSKWKGKCDNATLCNNKIIGLRNFGTGHSTDTSDKIKHGTHTASIAAGRPVQGASYFGQANGTVVGVAPLAHLAMYKISAENSNAGESAVLAAMDAAIEDGVDILSLSIGIGFVPHPIYDDVIALAAYAAIRQGIFVSCSAGNFGPYNSSVLNDAPWILTVGASTDDREIRATVLLGSNIELNGQSLVQPKDFPSTSFPLVYAGANGNPSSALCLPGSLRNVNVKGKIVLCERGDVSYTIFKGKEVKNNGGVAMILVNEYSDGSVTELEHHVVPTSHVSYEGGLTIKAYINSTSLPNAKILFEGTVTGLPVAPQVAKFSSRGPSKICPGILKPDIIGPGVNILAAWPISDDNTTNRFIMNSGTSMSCPQLSGIAALLKSAHPDWSPAAIKSAILTTANLHNLGGNAISNQPFTLPATFFEMGAGHVNISRANDPGMIYDIQPEDYIPYLCGLGYSSEQVGLIVQDTVQCSNNSSIPEAELNYPSFSIKLGSIPQTYTRTATNVGQTNSTYIVETVAPMGVEVKVAPENITFYEVNQNFTYSVTFRRNGNASGNFSQGYLNWVADKYNVRSPIAVVFE